MSVEIEWALHRTNLGGPIVVVFSKEQAAEVFSALDCLCVVCVDIPTARAMVCTDLETSHLFYEKGGGWTAIPGAMVWPGVYGAR